MRYPHDDEFYVVLNPEGRVPTTTYRSREQAEAEAKRLAKAQRGDAFYVMHAVSLSMAPPDVVTKALDAIPF